jgi:pilus assembly protein CpaE
MGSEDKKHHTAVLLPGARVMLFTRDAESKEAFMALAQDWRFARVDLAVKEGDIDLAISTFESETSPELVLVQTDKVDDAFSRKLEALSGACAAGTAAIVVGPVNDVNLYRKLVGMGVSDYLVRPLKTEVLGNDIAATLLEKMGAGESRLIALVGAKGGVGTTVLAEGLAWGLAGRLDQKTFLLDASGGWSTLSVGMNFEPTTTLAESVRAAVEGNEDSLSRMMFQPSDKLTVLSSGGDVMLEDIVQPQGYETLLDHIMATYPIVVADLSASPAALKRTIIARAHEIMLVTTPVLSAIRATRSLIHEIKLLRGSSDAAVDVVVNMVGLSPKSELPKGQIEEGLGRKAAAMINFDPDLFIRTESEGRKLVEDKDGAEAVEKLLVLARKAVALADDAAPAAGEGADGKGGLGRFMSKLKARS